MLYSGLAVVDLMSRIAGSEAAHNAIYVAARRYYSMPTDPEYYIYTALIVVAFLLCVAAETAVKMTFTKYSKVNVASGLTGAEVSKRIMQANGVCGVPVLIGGAKLSDHYDPSGKCLYLSPEVGNRATIAAVGVAAHETGHAMQDYRNYVPLRLRIALVPVVGICSKAYVPVLLVGFLLNGALGIMMVKLAVVLFAASFIFQIVTLPVEFNASHRAVRLLKEQGLVTDRELPYVKKVLFAAAMTYVTSALLSLMELLRFASRMNRRR